MLEYLYGTFLLTSAGTALDLCVLRAYQHRYTCHSQNTCKKEYIHKKLLNVAVHYTDLERKESRVMSGRGVEPSFMNE